MLCEIFSKEANAITFPTASIYFLSYARWFSYSVIFFSCGTFGPALKLAGIFYQSYRSIYLLKYMFEKAEIKLPEVMDHL